MADTVQTAIRKLRFVADVSGLKEVTVEHQRLEAATKKTTTTTSQHEKSLTRLEARIDRQARAERQLAKDIALINQLRAAGTITMARQNQLLALATKHNTSAAAATTAHARALAALNAQSKMIGGSVLAGAGLGGGAAGIGLAIGAAAALFVKNSIEAQKTLAQLEAVIASTGSAAGLTSRQLTAMASEMQRVTTYGDDAVISAQALLLTFTKVGKDVFPDAIRTILDMSTAMGTDLKSSAIQVGKALNDPIKGITALQRVGVSFTEAQKLMIESLVEAGDVIGAQRIILKELETEFGGSAKAARDTLGGALTALKNAFGDLFEVSKGGSDDLRLAIERLIDLLSDPATIAAVQGFGAALFSGFADAIYQVRLFGAQIDALLSGRFRDLANLTLVPGDGLFGIGGATDQEKQISNLLTELTKLKVGIAELGKQVRETDDFYDAFGDTFSKVTPKVGGGLREIEGETEGLTDALDKQQKAIDATIDSLTFQIEQLGRSAREQAAFNATKQAGVAIDTEAGQQVANLARRLYDLTEAQKAAADAQRAADAEMKAALRTIEAAVEARRNLASDIAFERATLFLSEEDAQIATRLRSIYGDDIPAALRSSEAEALRFNNQIRAAQEQAQDLRDELAGAIEDVFTGSIKTAEEFLEAVADGVAARKAQASPQPRGASNDNGQTKQESNERDDHPRAA